MRDPTRLINDLVTESLQVTTRFFDNNRDRLVQAADRVTEAFRAGRKVLLFGNGGSAADAQHLAAEFIGRFIPNRPPLAAIALSTDTSVLTACGNDYGYQSVFARQILALGNDGDIAIGISTSGNSPNVVEAFAVAQKKHLFTIGFTGESGGLLLDQVEILFRVPSQTTPRIQETHIMLGHILCELVDRALFPDAYPRD
jgi:D-sedoheptulose 7-phosphate isomerase